MPLSSRSFSLLKEPLLLSDLHSFRAILGWGHSFVRAFEWSFFARNLEDRVGGSFVKEDCEERCLIGTEGLRDVRRLSLVEVPTPFPLPALLILRVAPPF